MRLASRFLTKAWSLPPERTAVRVKQGVAVPMSDGTSLIADLYLPQCDPLATILVRSPYGRSISVSLLAAQVYAARGYQVLLQSCRGTFGSGGVFQPARAEIADAQDTVGWLREQPWFTGRLVTAGMSYMAFVQWALAMDPPPELVAAIVHAGPHDFSRAAFRGGAFELANFLGWSHMVAHQEEPWPLMRAIKQATSDGISRQIGMAPVKSLSSSMLDDRAPWFDEWLDHPDLTDAYWTPLQCDKALRNVDVPTLLVGGWHDVFVAQTLEQYRALASRGRDVRLVIGPWHHIQVGGQAIPMRESLSWLDQHVAGGAPDHGAVRVHVGGADCWRDLTEWPPRSQSQRWYLCPGKALAVHPPPEDDCGSADEFRFDPGDPTPSVGGAVMSSRAGAQDNRKLERRGDLVVYTSAPLPGDVLVLGEVVLELSLRRDNPNADVFARVCDVDRRGRSMNVCDTILRLTDSDPLSGTLTLKLGEVAYQFGAGHRLRLQISGGAYPRFPRNPGNPTMDDSDPSQFRSTEYRLNVTGESALLLPVAHA